MAMHIPQIVLSAVILISHSMSVQSVEPSNAELLERVKILEKQVKKQQKKSNKRLRGIKTQMDRRQDRFQINGFLTAGVIKGEGDLAARKLDLGEDLNFRGDSIAGLQFNYRLSDKIESVIQLVASGRDDFEVQAEWAYISYQITDAIKIRAGRMRIPFYLFSESIAVGFSYPWARPPIEQYSKDETSYEGFDFLYKFSTGDWSHQIQAVIGALDYPSYEADDAYGLNITSFYNSWTLRFGYTQSEAIFKSDTVEVLLKDNSYWDAGVMYDDGVWFALAEFTILDFDDPFRTRDANNFSVGRYIGRWMPYINHTHRYTTEKNDNVIPIEQIAVDDPTNIEASKNLTVGVRYALTSKVAITVETSHFYDFEKVDGVRSNGVFDGDTTGKDVEIYTINLDAIF